MNWELVGTLAIAIVGGYYTVFRVLLGTMVKHQEKTNEEMAQRMAKIEESQRQSYEKMTDALMLLEKALNRVEANSNRYPTLETCQTINRRIEDRIDNQIKTVKEEMNDKIDAVEDRLEKKIDKLG